MQSILRVVLLGVMLIIQSGAAVALPLTPTAIGLTKILPSDPAAGKRYGASVAVSGNLLAVGATNDQSSGATLGAAYIYGRQNNAWQQITKIVPPNPQGQSIGHSVALSGDTLLLGAQNGAAYVYDRNQGGANAWGGTATLKPSATQGIGLFGWSVGISSDSAIIGSAVERAAYIFDRDNGGPNKWGETKRLTPQGGVQPERFGFTTAISGDIAIVGAMYESSKGPEAGAAYIFERDRGGADNWGQAVRLVPSDLQEYDRFGQGVAVDGNTAVVGAWWNDGNGAQSGAAYVFQRDFSSPGQWTQVAKLIANDVTNHFGFSVGISGDNVIIGAPWDDDLGNQAGAAYIFGRDVGGPNSWGQLGKITATDSHSAGFGESVAISGNSAVVGVIYDSQLGYQSGAAYALTIPEPATAALMPLAVFALLNAGLRRKRV